MKPIKGIIKQPLSEALEKIDAKFSESLRQQIIRDLNAANDEISRSILIALQEKIGGWREYDPANTDTHPPHSTEKEYLVFLITDTYELASFQGGDEDNWIGWITRKQKNIDKYVKYWFDIPPLPQSAK